MVALLEHLYRQRATINDELDKLRATL